MLVYVDVYLRENSAFLFLSVFADISEWLYWGYDYSSWYWSYIYYALTGSGLNRPIAIARKLTRGKEKGIYKVCTFTGGENRYMHLLQTLKNSGWSRYSSIFNFYCKVLIDFCLRRVLNVATVAVLGQSRQEAQSSRAARTWSARGTRRSSPA